MAGCIHRRIRQFGELTWDVVMSTAGCFVFTRGFRQAASTREELDMEFPKRTDSTPGEALAGANAARPSVAFATSQAPFMIRALRP